MKKPRIVIIILGILSLIFILIFGNRMFHIIKPGERGVVFKTISGLLDKEHIKQTGLVVIAPWNVLNKYDVKEQQREETMDVLAKNGMSVNVDVTVRFNPLYDRIGHLHETFGINFVNTLVIPEVRSAVRKVMGRYTAEEIYSTKRVEVENTIIEESKQVLRDNFIDMRALLIRSINLPPQIKTAIETKLTSEQEALAMTFINEREKLEADRKLIEAQGIANYNRVVNLSLTENIITLRGIEATLEIAKSPNTKVIIVGSGDKGLPLILGGQ
jgi:regulator of protease activity HflC (stomatin/prohibitin superfamily)